MTSEDARPEAERDAGGMRAVERMSAILAAFTQSRPLLGLSDVARTAGLDKNTTRRILLAMCRTGLLYRTEETGLFGLDLAILRMQPAVLPAREIRDVASPWLQRLTERTGMTSFLWVPDPGGALCIETARAGGQLLDVPWSSPGTIVPCNMAGGPRVVLAWRPAPEREAWLARPQPGYTHSSQTDPLRLAAELLEIRKRGWELVFDDYYVGLAGLGVPMFSRTGSFVGAISITTLCSDLRDPDRVEDTLAAVREASAAIGVRLGAQMRLIDGRPEAS